MAPTDKNKPKTKNSASSKSTAKKATPRPVGQTLKKARLEKGIRLTQIVQQLNISQSYIQAIENGKINELPKEQTYTIGFVKSYAQAVDLDCQDIVEKFKQEFYAESDQYDLPEDEIETDEADSVVHGTSPNSKILWGSLGVAILAIVVWYSVSSNSLFKESENDSSDASMEKAAEETVSFSEEKPAPIDYPVAEQVTNGLVSQKTEMTEYQDSIPTDEKSEARGQDIQEVEETQPAKKIEVTFVYEDQEKDKVVNSQAGSDSTMTISENNFKQESSADVEPESKGFVSDPSKLPILITVKEDTWIEIRDPENEDLYLSKVITPRYIYQVPKKGLVLSTGNAGATLITVGSNSLPSIGKDGQVLKDIYLGTVELKEKYMK